MLLLEITYGILADVIPFFPFDIVTTEKLYLFIFFTFSNLINIYFQDAY